MNSVEFYILGADEELKLNSTQYIPRKSETVWIDQKKYRVENIVTKYRKDGASCWLERTTIFLMQYD